MIYHPLILYRFCHFQRTLHIEFMASTLQLAIEGILLNDYTTRMLVDFCTSCPLILVFFLVVIITAVGYDYSK